MRRSLLPFCLFSHCFLVACRKTPRIPSSCQTAWVNLKRGLIVIWLFSAMPRIPHAESVGRSVGSRKAAQFPPTTVISPSIPSDVASSKTL
jgi:hypothetical protein